MVVLSWRRRFLHEAFEGSLLLKGAFALLETLLGLSLFFVANETIRTMVRLVTSPEIGHDPTDMVARFLMDHAATLSVDTQGFYAFYLMTHGALKLAVVMLLARGYLWAFPMAVVVLTGFIVYQAQRYMSEPGIGLILLSLMDLAVIVLTILEYRARRRRTA